MSILILCGRTAAVLRGAASRICSKQHTVFLCSSHQAFSQGVSLNSTQYRLEESPFYFINDQLTVHTLPMCMLTSLLVDEILLSRYVTWCAHFRTSHLINHPKKDVRDMLGIAGRRKDKLINDILLWTTTHGHTSVGWPAKTYID